jgi:hypothetical protein
MKIMQFITENGMIKIKDMEEVYKFGQMEVNMKVIGKMIKQMLKEN